MAFNKVILMGNLVETPSIYTTPTGVTVTTFRMAVGRRVKTEGQPEADFVTIVAFKGTAEFICKHFEKGSPMLVCGHLQQRYFDDKTGARRSVLEVIADEVTFAGFRSEQPQTASDGNNKVPQVASAPKYEEVDVIDGELPF